MTGYYDYVLGIIPAALIGVTAILELVGLSLTVALPGGALVASAVVAHALFVRNPVADVRRRVDRSHDPSVRGAIDRAAERPRAGRSEVGRTGAGRSGAGRSRAGGSD